MTSISTLFANNSTWVSNGSASSIDELIPGTFPLPGTAFCLNPPKNRKYPLPGKDKAPYWELDDLTSPTIWKRHEKKVLERTVNIWTFSVVESNLDIPIEVKIGDPPQRKFLERFLKNFQALQFSEIGDTLVSHPMRLIDDKGNPIVPPGSTSPLSLTFVVEFIGDTMIQRAFGSDGYVAVYCCPLKKVAAAEV